MKNKIVIIGAGGHGKVCAEIALLNGYREVVFLDDDSSKEETKGTTKDLGHYIADYDVFVAVGDNYIREKLTETVKEQGATVATLIHPRSVVSPKAVIGEGSVVVAGAIVNPDVTVGKGVILNTCSSVDHDCIVSNFAHVAVGAHLAGTVSVGSRTLIGVGASVISNLSICENCIIGAGATVVEDVDVSGTYVGIPARRVL